MALNLLGGFFLLASWLAPNHYVPWTSFHGEAAAFFALVLLCLNRMLVANRSQSYTVNGFFLALVVIILLQYLFGLILYLGTAMLGCLYVAGGALAWWLGRNSLAGKRFDGKILTSFAWLICTGAILSIILALLQWLDMDADLGIFIANRGPGMRPFGNFAQPNHLATFCLMAVASAHLLHAQNKISRHLLLFLLVIFAFGVQVTESRTAILSLSAMTVFLIIFNRKVDVRRYFLPVAWLWLVLLLLQLTWGSINEVLLLGESRQVSLTHDNMRLTFWAQFARAIALSPWHGYGWTQGLLAQQSVALLIPGQLGTVYAHNFILDWLTWLGVPVGMAFLLMIVGIFVRLIKKVDDPTVFWLFCGVIPFVVHSLLEFPFAYAYFIFPVMWVLGRLRGASASISQGVYVKQINISILMVFSLLGFQVFREYMAVEEDFRVMRFEIRQVGQRPSDYQSPDIKILNQLEAILVWGRFTPHADMKRTDAEEVCKAASVENWAALQVKCAVSLYLTQDKVEAIKKFRLIGAIHGREVYTNAIDYLKYASVHEYQHTDLKHMVAELGD